MGAGKPLGDAIPPMDLIRHAVCLRFQLRSKPLFEVKGYQIPLVYAVLVGAVGIEPKAVLTGRKLLIRLNAKNAKYTGIAQLRYTPGTWDSQE
jgi:hypothetical protein